MADHQLAIGRLCNEWADLEMAVARFFIFASGMPPGNISFAICRALSFRDLLAASKVALIARFTNDVWIERATSEINYIDNHLRPERNRLVHDQWSLDEDGPVHLNVSPKLYRPQAHMHMHLQIAKVYGPTSQQILAVAEEMAIASSELDGLADLSPLSEAEFSASHSTPRERLLPRPQSESTDRGGINVRVR